MCVVESASDLGFHLRDRHQTENRAEKERSDALEKHHCQAVTKTASGVALHNYRYAWAERQRLSKIHSAYHNAAFRHDTKAVHQAYQKYLDETFTARRLWGRVHVTPKTEPRRNHDFKCESEMANRRWLRYLVRL